MKPREHLNFVFIPLSLFLLPSFWVLCFRFWASLALTDHSSLVVATL